MAKPDTQHSEYTAALARWQKCRDALDGEDAVHSAGVKYLPKLSGQTQDQYEAYVKRTPFYNATARTVDGLVGMLLRKEPLVDVPEAMKPFLADMTLTECSFNELAEIVAREVIGVGRMGAVVEYPSVDTSGMSAADAARQNLRPYVAQYKAETILNWRVQRVNNAMQLTMLTLKEKAVSWTDEFESKEVDQIRALLLTDGGYIQRIYQKSQNADPKSPWVQVGDDIVPIMNGKPLPFIPFVVFGPAHNDVDVQKPPIYDLVTLNLSHYRTAADLEHGAHYTGLPTPVVSGYSVAQGEVLAIGSGTAWVFPNPDAKAEYLEFTGQGLEALEKRLASKEAGMAAIGARMLAPEKNAAEAAKTVQLRHSGEGAILGTIGDMLDQGFTRILQIMADWSGISGKVSVDFNDEFVDTVLDAPGVLALVQAWQSGGISFDSLFWNLKQANFIDEERTVEQERETIKQDGIPSAPNAQNAE